MRSSERRAVLARLAGLLLEAAGVAVQSMMMTSSDALALPEAVLKRKAVVYVRQSTQAQVQKTAGNRQKSW
jgi:hypothetical protein